MPMAVAEVGRRGRAQRTMPHQMKRLARRMPLGVSIGVTVLGAEDEAAKVLERADRAMYARKHSRRGKKQSAVRR